MRLLAHGDAILANRRIDHPRRIVWDAGLMSVHARRMNLWLPEAAERRTDRASWDARRASETIAWGIRRGT